MKRNNIVDFHPPGGVHGLAPERIPPRFISVAPVRFNAHADYKTCGCHSCLTLQDPEFQALCAVFGTEVNRLLDKHKAAPLVTGERKIVLP